MLRDIVVQLKIGADVSMVIRRGVLPAGILSARCLDGEPRIRVSLCGCLLLVLGWSDYAALA